MIFSATVVLLDPAIGRIPLSLMDLHPLISTGFAALFWLALAVFDVVSQRRFHLATLVGGLVVIGGQPLALAICHTPSWQALAAGWIR